MAGFFYKFGLHFELRDFSTSLKKIELSLTMNLDKKVGTSLGIRGKRATIHCRQKPRIREYFFSSKYRLE